MARAADIDISQCDYPGSRDDEDIGVRIRLARTIERLSIEKLALRIQVSVAVLRHYERGARTIPARVLSEIAEVMGKSVAWFVPGDRYMDGALSAVDREPACRLAQSLAGRRLMASAAQLDNEDLVPLANLAVQFSRGQL